MASKIARATNSPLANIKVSQFAGGEWDIKILDKLRNQNAIIIQPTFKPINSNFVLLCLIANAVRRAGASYIASFVPYLAYTRNQTNATACINMLISSGIQHIFTIDLHDQHLLRLFPNLVTNISPAGIFAADILRLKLNEPIIVAPDTGAVMRSQAVANLLKTEIIYGQKHRLPNNQIAGVKINANLAGRDCIIVDDIIDSSNTIFATCSALKALGAAKIFAYCTHAILSANAVNRLTAIECHSIIITDSIQPTKRHKKLRTLEAITKLFLVALKVELNK